MVLADTVLFMPETKDMTLEEVDLVFSKPTRQLVAENVASTRKTASNLIRFRFKEAFPGFYTQRNRESREG